jgi:hypothetical protein
MATTIKVSGETHERLLQLTLRQSGLRGVRFTLEAVLTGLLDLADAHPDEIQPAPEAAKRVIPGRRLPSPEVKQ